MANINGNQNIIIQNVNDSTITVNVNGEMQEIARKLDVLQAFLEKLEVKTFQTADKIYNIEYINEANFDFVTGKKLFNEYLTKNLIESIQPHSEPVNKWLQQLQDKPKWESIANISDVAKNIIAFSFVGVLGIQLGKLMAIGKEELSGIKQQKYLEKCLHIAKWTLDLVNFALISKFWDYQKKANYAISDAQKAVLTQFFEGGFELSLEEKIDLLQNLLSLYKDNQLPLPLSELENIDFQPQSTFGQSCNALQSLNIRFDKMQYNLLDCFEAEKQLAAFLQPFCFLVKYRMASIKNINYQQIRHTEPKYLHRYASLGIDSKANIDAEKLNFTTHTTHTDSVLLYKGKDYADNINLFPFVIDYNALNFESGSRICFYRAKDLVGCLEYLFLDDTSTKKIEKEGLLKADSNLNTLMMDDKNRKTLNLDNVVTLFEDAQKAFLGDSVALDATMFDDF